MKVAIVHYWLVKMRGGENVLEALCELYPEADIYTHVYRPENISDVINDLVLDMNVKYNLTSIVITHDMRSVRKIADRVIMIHEGRIIFDGNIQEIEASDDPVIQKFIS